MNTRNGNEPRKVIVKTMTVNRGVDDVFNFFENIKNMEIGGAIKSVTKGEDDWWTFEHIVSGKSKIQSRTNKEFGILDHVFVGGGIKWNVYVRVVPNQNGSTSFIAEVAEDSGAAGPIVEIDSHHSDAAAMLAEMMEVIVSHNVATLGPIAA